MTQSHTAVRVLAVRQGQDIRAAQCVGVFPLTPALPLGEKVNLLSAENNPDSSAFHCAMRAVPSP